MELQKKRRGNWKPGQSGNPKGRTPGTGEVAKLRAGIAGHVPKIIAKLVELAKAGDVQASRLLLERVIAPIKPVEQPTPMNLPLNDTLTAQARAVLGELSAGTLAPGQGAQLIAAIGSLAKVAEIDELTERITKLEEGKRNE